MGLRAFTSQLLCEQVIGRGLRRVNHDLDENGFFHPEYVNVFGVPLSVFQDVGGGGEVPPRPKPSTQIESLPERNALEFRLQRLIFKAAAKAFDVVGDRFRGNREWLVFQLIRLVERFLDSGKVEIPSHFHEDPLRRRILIALNLDLVVQHLLAHVVEQNQERLEPVFDEENPIGSTRSMPTWYSTKPNLPTTKSQISHVVGDSSWEGYAANLFEMSDEVLAYAKNDHLGFQISYLWNGVRRRFVPDFLIRMTDGKMLVLEIKGEDSEQNRAKRAALDAWVRAVNLHGGFGVWAWDVAFEAARIQDIVGRH